ncbi:MAG: DNA mismatch repair protein MutS [Clostridia bacterium]|nr:DNA mismatch repair protein MutS [Clostridia bacterium]
MATMTPMMQHWWTIKEQHPDAIIFYRLGDFYEMFFDDAILASRVLDITLTGRDCGLSERAPMCGIPNHAADSYISKLVKVGHKVAICEQVGESDKKVLREVVRVITPGTITSDSMLDEKRNNFILCVHQEKNVVGVAYADISTGEFFTVEYPNSPLTNLNDLLVRILPSEIICTKQMKSTLESLPINKIMTLPEFQTYDDYAFEENMAISALKKQFGESALSVYEINQTPVAVQACGALLQYLYDTQKIALKHITHLEKVNDSKYLLLDITARRNLEIVETIRNRKYKGSLLAILDMTKTAMGGRMFRNWLEQPLKDPIEINARLDSVEEIYKNLVFRDNLIAELKQLADIERVTSKIGMKSILPKECEKLKKSLAVIPNLKILLSQAKSDKLLDIFHQIKDFTGLHALLEKAILNEPATHIKDGGFINYGYDAELDRLRKVKYDGKQWITNLEQREREETGIQTLKIKFTNVYGYFIEVNKNLAGQVPLRYQRKQTVSNYDRYFTPELKELEEEILTSEERANKIETQIFNDIREQMIAYIDDLQTTAKALCELDCLLSLAQVAVKNNYTKPKINKSIKHIKIVNGRHPVVESYLREQEFIPNDTFLNQESDKIMIITGPNMAGKSTFMRQVAVITLLAHVGSFVPAQSAEISITDRIFTRVGASDDLALGQSTFMVEMVEMSNILHNATDNSLIILDEIGRGTSTFDGLSIAWAVVEHLSKKLKAKVLFATHYHELTELEGMLEGIKNYKTNVKEINNNIVFLRKIVRGGANRSFGIEVASLAGLPNEIITRAKEISHNIEQQDFNLKLANVEAKNNPEQTENLLANNQVLNILKELDVNKITPLDAFEILQDLKGKLK